MVEESNMNKFCLLVIFLLVASSLAQRKVRIYLFIYLETFNQFNYITSVS